MKNSRAKTKTARSKPVSPRHPQPRRKPRTPYGLLQRKGPYRNLIEIPGMKGRTLERVEIYTATGYHSLTFDFEDQTSLSPFASIPASSSPPSFPISAAATSAP